MTDEAQAVAEVAKTAGEIVKAAGGFGAYLARVFGSIPENTLGLIGGDWLAHKRRRHLAVLEENTARILGGIAEDRLTEPSPSVLIPLLQAAVDEGRPELQAMWAALMSNAMIDGGKKVRRDYIDALRQMEPSDAAVLDIVSRRPNQHNRELQALQADARFFEAQREAWSLTEDVWHIGLDKLARLNCIGLPGPRALVPIPDLTPFGRGLVAACKVA